MIVYFSIEIPAYSDIAQRVTVTMVCLIGWCNGTVGGLSADIERRSDVRHSRPLKHCNIGRIDMYFACSASVLAIPQVIELHRSTRAPILTATLHRYA